MYVDRNDNEFSRSKYLLKEEFVNCVKKKEKVRRIDAMAENIKMCNTLANIGSKNNTDWF